MPHPPESRIKKSPILFFSLIHCRLPAIFPAIAMKKFSAIFSLAAMFLQSSCFAWVGGPYSNNTTDGIDGGIFQYTIRGSRTSGMSRFSQNTGSAFNSEFGDSIIYHRGVTYYGESYGFVDFASKRVDGIINAASAGSDNNPQNAWRNSTGTTWGVFNGVRYGNPNPVNGAGFDPTNPLPSNSVVNATWRGKLTRTRPVPRFAGRGEASFLGENNTTTTTTVLASSGDFQTPPAPPAQPSNGRRSVTVTVTGDVASVERTVRIRVYGGRVGLFPYLGTNQFQAL